MVATKKNPWARPRKDDWIAPGKRIIPIPSELCAQFGLDPTESDWTFLTPTPTAPENTPAFVIDEVRPNGMVAFHREGDRRSSVQRLRADILEKWRPAPDPPKRSRKSKKTEPEEEPVILSRFEREDLI